MRILLVSLLLGVGLVGCGDDTTSAGGGDLAMTLAHDMAVHGDLAIAVCADAGPKMFGDTCTTDCECDTSMCRQFQMGATHAVHQAVHPGDPGHRLPGAVDRHLHQQRLL